MQVQVLQSFQVGSSWLNGRALESFSINLKDSSFLSGEAEKLDTSHSKIGNLDNQTPTS